MSFKLLAGAFALAAATLPSVALADDPRDPAMMSAEARARDAAMIRKLNRDMLAQVQARDASYAKNWQAYRDAPKAQAEYRKQMAAYERDRASFAAERKRYEQARAKWERDVAACRAGDYSACD
jgi:Skp family chaperone for outer membrane proteins